jgi:glutathione-independent formaldehyde dehydrogenase
VPGLEAEVAGQPAAPGIEDVEVDAGLAQHRLIRVVALDKLIEVVRATGRIGVVGVYNPQDSGAATESAKEGRYGFNYGLVFDKAISMGHGQCPVKRYNTGLRDLIIRGKARPSLIVSHELPLDQAPDAYAKFDRRQDGWTKVLLRPAA